MKIYRLSHLAFKICYFQSILYIAITKLNNMKKNQTSYEQESFSPTASYIIITIIVIVALLADNLF